jgi:hypothetical protein
LEPRKRISVPVLGYVNAELGSALTEIEFALRTARALASTFPDKATNFVVNALRQTVDPRLRHLLEPALAALGRNEGIVARKWLDRACEYERARRERIKTRIWINTGNPG